MCPREFQKHVKKLVVARLRHWRMYQLCNPISKTRKKTSCCQCQATRGTSHRGDIGSNNARQKRRFPVIVIKGEKYLLIMKFSIRHIQ